MSHTLRGKFLRFIYSTYAADYKNWVVKIHRMVVGSPLVVKMLFGMKVTPEDKEYYFDLTTVLLKMELEKMLTHSPDMKLLEIGVGEFAILSGSISKKSRHTIYAADIVDKYVESSNKNIELNKVNVKAFQSDLFSNVPEKKFDLIFWNLPYYNNPKYLEDFFNQAPQYMSDNAKLIIGYNSTPLKRDTILNILHNSEKGLSLIKTKTYSWNLHEIVFLKKNLQLINKIIDE